MNCDFKGGCNNRSCEYIKEHWLVYLIGVPLMFAAIPCLITGVVLMTVGACTDLKLFGVGLLHIAIFGVIGLILESDFFKPISNYHSCRARRYESSISQLRALDERLKNVEKSVDKQNEL